MNSYREKNMCVKYLKFSVLVMIFSFSCVYGASSMLMSDDDIKDVVNDIFKSYNSDTIELAKVIDQEQLILLKEMDKNSDGFLTRIEVTEFLKNDNTPVRFEIKETTAFMSGVITSDIIQKVSQLLLDNPEIKTIEMIAVPGSIDDEANLKAALAVRKAGLTTKLNKNSSVASGGTDFFLAGKVRIVEQGAKIGVHSWSGGLIKAIDLPKNHPEHKKYLEFYDAVNVPRDFYWYTLEAAPAEGIHLMTEDEILKYNIRL